MSSHFFDIMYLINQGRAVKSFIQLQEKISIAVEEAGEYAYIK